MILLSQLERTFATLEEELYSQKGSGLSTALFVMGREKAEDYWLAHPDFEFILLEEDGTAVITEGLEGSFSLFGDWAGRPLEVVRREALHTQ